MKFREYAASKAATLCMSALAAIVWGIFAYLTGANPVLLWLSEGFFVAAVVLRYAVGYALAKRKLDKLQKSMDGLSDKYLLGEMLEKPFDATEYEYYSVMSAVSRSAIGAVKNAEREKEEYMQFVEQWIHEIKTPLTACSLICDNGADAVKIKRELKRADNLTDSALYYARLRKPETDTVIAQCDVSCLIAEAIKSQRELLVAAKISVETSGDFSVFTDGKSVVFVIKQLLINCAKYCAGCRVTITAADGTITVADNGIGIAAHELPRITARGFTGEAGRKAGSTGMGLYIASEICKRIGISFSVISELGKGTTFELKFDRTNNLTKM